MSFEDIKKIILLAKLAFREKWKNLRVNQKSVNNHEVLREIRMKLLNLWTGSLDPGKSRGVTGYSQQKFGFVGKLQ